MRRKAVPYETAIDGLGRGGVGLGRDPAGRRVDVRNAPPGSVVRVIPTGRGTARRLDLVTGPPGQVTPACPYFTRCGGCALQDLELATQRRWKAELARTQVAPANDVIVHAPRGVPEAYGIRNRLELSFGNARWLDEEEVEAGLPREGRFLGFHAPGRFDRIVDVHACAIARPELAAALTIVRAFALADGAPPTWDPRAHTGFWRHLGLRVAEATGEVLVALHTTSPSGPADEAVVEALAAALLPVVSGVGWFTFDGVADAALGTMRASWGATRIDERLGGVTFGLSHRSFFQTTTAGAEVLLGVVREALGVGGRTLVDLYAGTGAFGLPLAGAYADVLGIEEVDVAVLDARAAAARAGIGHARFEVAKVEEALRKIPSGPDVDLLVDPPRVGLHQRVAEALATATGRVLVYVACHPPSLGRDTVFLIQGGWRMTDLWTVDLFPQTGHTEVVARFVRRDP